MDDPWRTGERDVGNVSKCARRARGARARERMTNTEEEDDGLMRARRASEEANGREFLSLGVRVSDKNARSYENSALGEGRATRKGEEGEMKRQGSVDFESAGRARRDAGDDAPSEAKRRKEISSMDFKNGVNTDGGNVERAARLGVGLTRSSSQGAFQGINEFGARARGAVVAEAASRGGLSIIVEDESRAKRGRNGSVNFQMMPSTPVGEESARMAMELTMKAKTAQAQTTQTTSSDDATTTVYEGDEPSSPASKNEAKSMVHGEYVAVPRTCGDVEKSSPSERKDEADGHMTYEVGDIFADEYKVLSVLGEGTFGRVLEVWDIVTERRFALKVIRNVQKYRDAAMIEIEVLQTLSEGDAAGGGETFNCIKLRRAFLYREHVCMVFDKCGPSLFDFLRTNKYKPFHPKYVQIFCKQLLVSVRYLHSMRLVHTDLKPENVLLVSSSYKGDDTYRVPIDTTIRLIDYGSTTFEDRHHSAVVSTRHYRAPEIILGLGWSYPCDMWSFGCIMLELVHGHALFQTHDDIEHLAMMQHALEAHVPQEIALRRRKSRCKDYFDANGLLNWPNSSTDDCSYAALGKTPVVRVLINQYFEGEPRRLFADLLRRMLEFDPRRRITARDAINHPFFNLDLENIPWDISRLHKSNDTASA